MSEVRVDLTRMHGAALSNESEHGLGSLLPLSRPRASRRARMHQRAVCSRQEPIVDEKILLQREPRIVPLQISRPIACHAMSQHEILSAGGSADWVGLNEAEFFDRPTERGLREQRSSDRIATQSFFSNLHSAMILKSMAYHEPISRTHVSHGLKLHYLDWGNDGAPLLLLIHGMRDHARSWDWTARALQNSWHIIAPDLRGHGDSHWSPDGAYLSPYHVLDIADLIDTLGTEQVAIVAHSFGGQVAARYAALFPERIRKLVLVDGLGPSARVLADWAGLGPVKRTREWIRQRREADTRAPRRFATVDEAVARMAATNRHLSVDQARHLALHGVRLEADGYGWKYDPVVGKFLPEDFSVDNAWFWREISAPTLLCWGTESWTSNPKTDGRAESFRDHRTLVFEKAGHWLHHDQLDTFLVALQEFL
jgi:pimeloyl-ACP methyl ester carboxylesterase